MSLFYSFSCIFSAAFQPRLPDLSADLQRSLGPTAVPSRPCGSNRQKGCPKSSANFHRVAVIHSSHIAQRISHSHSALTVAGATRIEHHCGTCGDRDATDFFCSALRAHMSRPIPHRSSQLSRPAFFCHSFSRALLRAHSCVRQLRGFCFPGSALTHHWVPSDKAAARFGSRSHSLPGAPRKWGKKKEKIQSWLTYMLSGIASGVVCSPAV